MAGKSLFRKENEHVVLAGAVLLLGILVLLPFLGSFGFWDPQEISVADRATKLYEKGGYVDVWKTQLPLTPWAIATGVANLGKSEFGARFPLALFGIAAVLATYGLGARLRRPRAGLFAAVVLLASPMFLFQARQLTSDIGAVAGSAIAMFGLVGLSWPSGDRPRRALHLALDVLLVVLGLTLGLLSAGLVLGVLVPLATVGLAAVAFGRRTPALVFATLAVGVFLFVCRLLFKLEPAQPGSLAIFGQMVVPSTKYIPLLGGAWRTGDPSTFQTFNWIVEQVAFGMFPWSAIAPIAVVRLAFVRSRDRASWAGILVVAWATIAYGFATLWVRHIGDVRYSALSALALAIGFLFDDAFRAKVENDVDVDRLPSGPSGTAVLAVFILLAGFILSLDLRNFPEELASIPALGSSIRVPGAIFWLVYATMILGIGISAAAAAGLGVSGGDGRLFGVDRRLIVRAGLLGSLAGGLLYGIFLSWIYTPRVAEHYSQRNVFEAYFEHRKGDEPLGVMGIGGSGPEYYARGRLERLDTVPDLLKFFQEAGRVFAIVPASQLCTIHQSNAQSRVKYHVVDARNSRFFLFSNQLADGEKDVSPIVAAFHTKAPDKVDRPISATWEDTVELFGVDVPDRVRKGDTFKMTLWFKVKKRFSQSQKIFVHFDGVGLPVRFQKDHDPSSCSTTYWQPGDIVADTFEVVAGELTHPRGTYGIYTGFFVGGGGIWKNMTVTDGPKADNNRVPLGNIRVE